MAISVGGYEAIASSEAVKRIETKLEFEVGSIGKLAATVTHHTKMFHRYMTESSTDGSFTSFCHSCVCICSQPDSRSVCAASSG
jgi:hypothetical protein